MYLNLIKIEMGWATGDYRIQSKWPPLPFSYCKMTKELGLTYPFWVPNSSIKMYYWPNTTGSFIAVFRTLFYQMLFFRDSPCSSFLIYTDNGQLSKHL